jgi:hypothetical protein
MPLILHIIDLQIMPIGARLVTWFRS